VHDMGALGRKQIWAGKIIFFIGLLLCIPMHSYAYFGENEDYILSAERPLDRTEGHFLEFASEETYTVKEGDTLWGIAQAQLGDGSRYGEIKSLNGLSSDTIYPNQVLRLP